MAVPSLSEVVLGIIFVGVIMCVLTFIKWRNRDANKIRTKTAIERVIEIIQGAENKILIVSGELCHATWDSPDVLKAIKKALDKGVKISIFAGPWLDIKSKEILRMVLEGRIAFYFNGWVRQDPHAVLNDLEVVRYWEHHPLSREWDASGEKDYQNEFSDKPLETSGFWDKFKASLEDNAHFRNRLKREATHRFTHSYRHLCTQPEIDGFLKEMGA